MRVPEENCLENKIARVITEPTHGLREKSLENNMAKSDKY